MAGKISPWEFKVKNLSKKNPSEENWGFQLKKQLNFLWGNPFSLTRWKIRATGLMPILFFFLPGRANRDKWLLSNGAMNDFHCVSNPHVCSIPLEESLTFIYPWRQLYDYFSRVPLSLHLNLHLLRFMTREFIKGSKLWLLDSRLYGWLQGFHWRRSPFSSSLTMFLILFGVLWLSHSFWKRDSPYRIWNSKGESYYSKYRGSVKEIIYSY